MRELTPHLEIPPEAQRRLWGRAVGSPRRICDDDFREALDQVPPGTIDPRSWAYWNSKMGRYPAPPLPTRRFGAETVPESSGKQGRESKRVAPEDGRKQAVKAWLDMREQQPARQSPEEMRRRAARECSEKYGHGKKP